MLRYDHFLVLSFFFFFFKLFYSQMVISIYNDFYLAITKDSDYFCTSLKKTVCSVLVKNVLHFIFTKVPNDIYFNMKMANQNISDLLRQQWSMWTPNTLCSY